MVAATGSTVLPPERAGSPGSLIVAFAGSYLRELGGWISVADLIRCLNAVDVGDSSVRQALMRLKSRGFFAAERRSNDAGYALTQVGLHDLETGDRRIFRHGQAGEDDGWVLAVFSVPETDRHQRHRLRNELSWLGFGTVCPGVWVAPAPLAAPSRDLLAAAGLDQYVTWFQARHLGEVDVAAWWDLSGLERQYAEFLDHWHSPDGSGGPLSDEAAFARYLRLVDAWRLFPRLDPGLPASLLPAAWPARQAWEVFRDLREQWSAPGWRFVRSVTGSHANQPG